MVDAGRETPETAAVEAASRSAPKPFAAGLLAAAAGLLIGVPVALFAVLVPGFPRWAIPLAAASGAATAGFVAARSARRFVELVREAGERELKLEKRVIARADELSAAYNQLADKHESMRKELRVARDIQGCIVGRLDHLPPRPELDVAAWYRAMDNVGGDLYDVVRIGRNSYGFLMADVAGHGVPAALVTALVKVAFDGKAAWGIRPEGVCDAVNRTLCQLVGEQDRFVTAWYGILDLETGLLRYTNAGHHPPVLIRKDGTILRPDTECQPLGIIDEAPFYSVELTMSPGDRMVLFTDGIVEARNYLKEEFGYARFLEAIGRNPGAPPGSVIDGILADLNGFLMGAPPEDDRAILAFEFRGFAPRPA
ncbi:MAG: serine/threonine-protein phosphatase [Spirochaetales bacterium]|nr:serine/threonine-protein phosphatase [Spirochaetales bacterium]